MKLIALTAFTVSFFMGLGSAFAINDPPDCSGAFADPLVLWPPNHKLSSIDILGVTDPDGDPVSLSFGTVSSNEPDNGLGDGDTSNDIQLVSGTTLLLRAERSGLGDGRIYLIDFTASDGAGGTCTGQVTVCVPHDARDLYC